LVTEVGALARPLTALGCSDTLWVFCDLREKNGRTER